MIQRIHDHPIKKPFVPVSTMCAMTTAALWIAASGLAYILTVYGLATWLAIALVPLMILSVPATMLGIQFATGAYRDVRPKQRLGAAAMLRLWCSETWMWWRMFSWHMPFKAKYPEPTIVHDAQRPAVLLVHGFANNRAVWATLINSELFKHCNLATVNLEPPFASIDEYCQLLDHAVHALAEKSGANQIILVCHSMGGLAARAYLRYQSQNTRVATPVVRVITVGTPHKGTVFAHWSTALNAKQMRPGSEYLNQLQIDTAPFANKIVCIGSVDDNLIVPRSSQWLDGAQCISLTDVGHFAALTNEQVLKQIAHAVGLDPSVEPKGCDQPPAQSGT